MRANITLRFRSEPADETFFTSDTVEARNRTKPLGDAFGLLSATLPFQESIICSFTLMRLDLLTIDYSDNIMTLEEVVGSNITDQK